MSDFLQLLIPTLFYALCFFALVWVISETVANAGIVDIAWSLSFTVFAGFYALMGSGAPLRKLILLLLVAAWSLRLGFYIAKRVKRTHPIEDERYTMAREMWGARVRLKFFLFFLAQGLLAVVLSLPHLLVALNARPEVLFVEWLGIVIVLVGMAGESLADKQLNDFRQKPENRGLTCRVGLWKYSRHPNYFFEFIIWCGFAILALGSPWGWVALYTPALMFYFLWFVTGIPLTEKRALASRGDDYRDYQATTSPFFPWFPKRPGSSQIDTNETA